jgi:hypothetical protein
MDTDELALPVYATLSASTKAKLAALPKGELMIRHPHFTQPVFVRFPRPAVMPGRVGVERFPPALDIPFAEAVTRQLRLLDRSVTTSKVEAIIEGHRDDDVRRALASVRRTRPDNVLGLFSSVLGKRIDREVVPPRGVPALKQSDDPYR